MHATVSSASETSVTSPGAARTAPSRADATALFQRPPARFIDVGHSRLAYYSVGRGPDVVFVHGWPLHSATFRTVLPALARSFTCHLVDLPGTGQTESGEGAPMGLAEHAATIRSAIDVLGLTRYALLAHDSGGAIARLVAVSDRRVRGLVLENTEIPGHHSFVFGMYVALSRIPGAGEIVRQLLKLRSVRRSPIGFAGCFDDPRAMEGEFHDFFVKPMVTSPSVFDGQLGLLRKLDSALVDGLERSHAQIEAPVRLIWGARDPFFPIAEARAMLAQFRSPASFYEIPRGKLYAHEEFPEEFVAGSLPFLQAVLSES